MESINGVTCIKGEIHNIMTLLRLNTRWAAPARFSGELLIQDESPLVQSFRRLNEQLEGIFDLRNVDCVSYLQPFHQVIISEQASGPLTSAALSSVSKFVLYGFLSPYFIRASEGINLIASCIPRCLFEETNWESDEVIFMKLLELSGLCLQCDASGLLTVSAAWEIYSTCMSIHSQHRASKLLRSEAETALRHLTLTTFSRASSLPAPSPPSHFDADCMSPSGSSQKLDTGRLELQKSTSTSSESIVRTWETASEQYNISGVQGIPLLLGRIMHSLSNNIDPKQKPSPENVQFYLSLINIALEAGGPSLGTMDFLVDVLRGDVCRHLLNTSQSENLAVFSLSLRVVFNLFMSIKDHMKVQLEVFLTSVHLRILHPSTAILNATAISSAREELALESLLEFCREPSLMHDIYTNYDCDVQCTNLFDSIVTTLCARATPSGALSVQHNSSRPAPNSKPIATNVSFVNILNRLSLEGVLIILHAVAVRCSYMQSQSFSRNPPSSSGVSRALSGELCAVETKEQMDFAPLSSGSGSSCTPPVPIPMRKTLSDVDRWCLEGDDDDNDSPHSPVSELNKKLPSKLTVESSSGTEMIRTGSVSRSTGDLREAVVRPVQMVRSVTDESTSPSVDEEDESEFIHLARAKTAEILRQRKLKKQRLRLASEKFNEKPLSSDWVRFAADLSLLPKIQIGAESTGGGAGAGLCSAKDIAEFLKNTPGLGKTQVGEYLSKGPADKYPFHAEVLKEYVNTFTFSSSTSFVDALRNFLGHFRLPGEAQCIDRLMEAFAGRIFSFLGQGNPFVSADAAFILAFSIIMLNTDLHNPSMTSNRMKVEDFIRNNRGINGGEDLPREYLEELYHEIKSKEIMVDAAITDADSARVDYSDTASWKKLIHKGLAHQAPASFTPTVAARRGANGDDTCASGALSLFPPSAHERDMFQVMAKQVLDVVLDVWCCTDDDILLCRILAGLCDYATVCLTLDMADHLDSMIQLIACFALSALEKDESTGQSDQIDSSQIDVLVTIDFDRLVKYGAMWRHGRMEHENTAQGENTESCSGPGPLISASHDDTPWNGLRHVRGHMLLLLLFHIGRKCSAHISKGSWLALTRVLLWAHSRHVLPKEVTELEDFSNAKGTILPPSVYAERCEQQLLEAEARMKLTNGMLDNGRDSSLWESVASLGGLLWAPGGQATPPTSSTGYTSRRSRVEMSAKSRRMLGLCLSSRTIEALLFSCTKDITCDRLGYVIWCMLGEAVGSRAAMADFIRRTETLHTMKHQNRIDSFFGFDSDNSSTLSRDVHLATTIDKKLPDKKRSAQDVVESNAVLLLEWVSKIVSVNRSRAAYVWPHVHDFLKYVLEEAVDDMLLSCPYLVERSVVAVIRAAVHLLQSPEDEFKDGLTATLPAMTGGAIGSMQCTSSQCVWASMRLLREVPHEIFVNIADRLGAGLVTFIRGSPGVAAVSTLEQWFLIFSLLSSAAASSLGQPYVWEIICFLIDNNLINSMNFTPCRHLVIQFMNRNVAESVMPSADPVSIRESQMPHRNPWITGALFHLMRLTLMGIAGYSLAMDARRGAISSTSRKATDQEGSHQYSEPKKTIDQQDSLPRNAGVCGATIRTPQFMKFPIPNTESAGLFHDSLSSSAASATKDSPSPQSSAAGSSMQASDTAGTTTVVTVVCVDFLHIEEVVNLWLDNIKIFCEFANTRPLEISRNATFCLKAILMAARLTPSLPPRAWLDALIEMISRLPISTDKTCRDIQQTRARRHSNGTIQPLPLKEKEQVLEMCLRCSVIVFDTMVLHFKAIRNDEKFQSLWLRYMTILAQNINVASSVPSVRDEYVGMIGSLLRLLQRPPSSSTSVHTLSPEPHPVGAQITQAADNDKLNSEQKVVTDSTLLLISWRAVKAGCPSLVALLRGSYPYIVETLLSLEKDQESKGRSNSSTSDSSSEGKATQPTLVDNQQRSVYSFLFNSKTQIV
mmetsp:Transcript_20608/g.29575  ORF Transcript_20608/g.29575 Transcript_20608/m.29575 type:complete len:1961 (+) Transcript_20608:126-6008(+)